MKETEKPTQETYNKWHSDPSNWKLGIFYYNKQDKRFFPIKSTYLGWTMNFANPLSILSVILLAVVLILIIGYFK